MSKYQLNFSDLKPLMFDKKSREQRGVRIFRVIKNHLGNKTLKNLSVLDIGSSTGIIDNFLSKKFKRVVGIDIDKKAIKFAQKNFKRKNLRFELGDAMKLNFTKNSFNIVICTQIYEHVPDPNKLFAEIYHVLKPGGVCYLSGPNRLWPWEPHYDLPFLSWLPKPVANQYVKIFGKANEYYETPLTPWELKKLISKFKVIDYTAKILKNPSAYGYSNKWLNYMKPITTILSPLLIYLTPTVFWLLIKPQKKLNPLVK